MLIILLYGGGKENQDVRDRDVQKRLSDMCQKRGFRVLFHIWHPMVGYPKSKISHWCILLLVYLRCCFNILKCLYVWNSFLRVLLEIQLTSSIIKKMSDNCVPIHNDMRSTTRLFRLAFCQTYRRLIFPTSPEGGHSVLNVCFR